MYVCLQYLYQLFIFHHDSLNTIPMYHSSFTNHHSSLSCTSHHKSNLLSMFLIYVFMYLCTHVWRVNTHSGKDFWIKTWNLLSLLHCIYSKIWQKAKPLKSIAENDSSLPQCIWIFCTTPELVCGGGSKVSKHPVLESAANRSHILSLFKR